MKKSNGNYIKTTIYKARICSESSITSYSLKLEFGKQTCESDKISGKEAELGGKVKINLTLF